MQHALSRKVVRTLLAFPVFFLSPLLCAAALSEEPPAGLRHERLRFHDHDYDVVSVDLKKARLELFWKDKHGCPFNNFEGLRSSLESEGRQLLFATNSGIYARDNTPLGLHVENKHELRRLNTTKSFGRGNFSLKPNGVFYVDDAGAHVLTTEAYQAAAPTPELAVQSGPMLVIKGELHPRFQPDATSRHIRNGVGVRGLHEVVFVISRVPVNFHEFASLFREQLGCPDALYLDGTLSGMYAPFAGRQDSGLHYVGMLAVTAPKE
ncbi:MAG: phosphodiester glycosidase family protein [Candidatus Hydrogenedentes bacterium]|nr:phosphodiester glycosidase family protein [Candidatus Hydrogenedentota bacterium]